jgi:hypothetical protein
MAEMVQNKKQPGVIFLKGKAYYNKGTVVEGGDGKSSTLTVIEDIYEHSDVLYFENDSRFEITSNERPFSVQTKFQYDGHDMYSPSTTGDNQQSYTRIKNISNKPIYLKVHYIVSSEDSDDWLSILIRDIPEQDDDNYMINVSGEKSGDIELISLPADYILEMRYSKDRSAARGQDSGGFLFYELGKEEE